MPETLADLLRQVGLDTRPAAMRLVDGAREQGRPVVPRPRPRQMRSIDERARDPNAGVRNQAFAQALLRERMNRDAQTTQAFRPGIDPNTGLNQGQEALLMHLEPTGAPALVRAYRSAQEGRPLSETAGHFTMGALGVLGMRGAMPSRAPARGALRPPVTQAARPSDGGARGASNAGQTLNWLGHDRLIRNPTDADLTRLAELGDEMKYVMDTDGNIYAFSAADAHHNNAMRALRDNGVTVRPLGSGAEITDPDAAGFIWRNSDGSFVHENADMVASGPFSAFQQRMRPPVTQGAPPLPQSRPTPGALDAGNGRADHAPVGPEAWEAFGLERLVLSEPAAVTGSNVSRAASPPPQGSAAYVNLQVGEPPPKPQHSKRNTPRPKPGFFLPRRP